MSISDRSHAPPLADRPAPIALAYVGFVVLGLSGGLLGVGWPSIRGSFGVSLAALGLLLTASTAGYVVASFSSGRLIARLGVGPLLVAAGLVSALGLLGYALSPTWAFAILAAVVTGVGTASIDSGLNTYVALHGDSRVMNWLHASYGVGATLGPALMTVVITSGLGSFHGWRYGYAAAALANVALAACFVLTLSRWQAARSPAEPDLGATLKYLGSAGTLRLPALWLGIALAFIHTGTEVTAGQWSYTLLTESRAIAAETAGLWVSIFWGSFTVARLIGGLTVARIGVPRLVQISSVGMVIGAFLLWWRGAGELSLFGLVLIGVGIAPIFPLLMSTTPRLVGAAHAANAIGFEISGASLGLAILPSLVGLAAESHGLELIGPCLVVGAIVTGILSVRVIGRT